MEDARLAVESGVDTVDVLFDTRARALPLATSLIPTPVKFMGPLFQPRRPCLVSLTPNLDSADSATATRQVSNYAADCVVGCCPED